MKKRGSRRKIVPGGARRASGASSRPKLKLKLGPIRKQLLEMRDDLTKTVRRQELSESGLRDVGDPVDDASQSIERELLFELSDNERTTLDQIEAALRKIDKAQYGLCESCQKPIGAARLKALPFARYCISCQSSSESQSPEMSEGPAEYRILGEEAPRETTER
ncbi:MAG: TraR/DksA family transcriptional regulator [Elusimicrobia bacterium]|nr:TraR/DksA family transcriptional regulator [Elusimicrobiota bacterium]